MKKLNLFGPVYGYSDCVNAQTVGNFLNELQDGEEFTVYLNSPGGSVFEGLAIFNLLKEHQNQMTIKIVGEASSIASVIACAAAKGKTLIAETALMLIHNPWMMAIVDENYIKKLDKALTTIKSSILKAYNEKSGLSNEELNNIMSEADYHNAEDCVAFGIADEVYNPSVDESKAIAASETVKNELLRKYEVLNLIIKKENAMTIEEAKAEALKFQSELNEAKAALNSVNETLANKDSELKNATEQLNVLKMHKDVADKIIADLNAKVQIDEAKAFCEEMFQAGKLTRAEINGNAKVADGETPAKVQKLVKLKNASEDLYKMEVDEIKARSSQIGYLKNDFGLPEGDQADDQILKDYINEYNKGVK